MPCYAFRLRTLRCWVSLKQAATSGEGHTSIAKSTSKLPTAFRKGAPPLTVPDTLMSRSELMAALNLLLLMPSATVMEVNTSLHHACNLHHSACRRAVSFLVHMSEQTTLVCGLLHSASLLLTCGMHRLPTYLCDWLWQDMRLTFRCLTKHSLYGAQDTGSRFSGAALIAYVHAGIAM